MAYCALCWGIMYFRQNLHRNEIEHYIGQTAGDLYLASVKVRKNIEKSINDVPRQALSQHLSEKVQFMQQRKYEREKNLPINCQTVYHQQIITTFKQI